jgi:hypothetical protein
MKTMIGDSAGKVWKFLSTNGSASISKVAKETGLGKTDIQRAIGWLAREEKISITQKGRTETISLEN